MAQAQEIFIAIKQKIRFQQAEKEKDSHYTILGNTLVRISNHCTYMNTWENYLDKHPKCKGMKIASIVFEDGGSTFSEECLYTVQQREKPIVVTEYVYSSSSLQKADIKEIIGSLQKMDYTNEYSEPTNTIQAITRVSKNPPITESKTRTITESQLKRIISESICKVLFNG